MQRAGADGDGVGRLEGDGGSCPATGSPDRLDLGLGLGLSRRLCFSGASTSASASGTSGSAAAGSAGSRTGSGSAAASGSAAGSARLGPATLNLCTGSAHGARAAAPTTTSGAGAPDRTAGSPPAAGSGRSAQHWPWAGLRSVALGRVGLVGLVGLVDQVIKPFGPRARSARVRAGIRSGADGDRQRSCDATDALTTAASLIRSEWISYRPVLQQSTLRQPRHQRRDRHRQTGHGAQGSHNVIGSYDGRRLPYHHRKYRTCIARVNC